MNQGRTVFSQLMDLFPLPEFRRCVGRYRGDYKVQRLSCLDQFLALAFAQPTWREEASPYKSLQILSLTLFEKMPILQVLQGAASDLSPCEASNQLSLFD